MVGSTLDHLQIYKSGLANIEVHFGGVGIIRYSCSVRGTNMEKMASSLSHFSTALLKCATFTSNLQLIPMKRQTPDSG